MEMQVVLYISELVGKRFGSDLNNKVKDGASTRLQGRGNIEVGVGGMQG